MCEGVGIGSVKRWCEVEGGVFECLWRLIWREVKRNCDCYGVGCWIMWWGFVIRVVWGVCCLFCEWVEIGLVESGEFIEG